jgi:hypothetical protein
MTTAKLALGQVDKFPINANDRELVRQAIEKMDAKIAEGWTYRWSVLWNSELKMCCLGGAFIEGEYSNANMFQKQCYDFLSAEAARADDTSVAFENRWSRVKQKLQEKYRLVPVTD